jgi:YqxM protein
MIFIQLFTVYYVLFITISYVHIGTPTNAYFSDGINTSLVLKPPEGWGKSSLMYVAGTTKLECSTISATFKNKNDSEPMNTNLRFGIYRDVPSNDDIQLTTGELDVKLGSGESYEISYNLSEFGSGTYIIRVFQEEGHPGNSHPPSDAVQYDGECGVDQVIEPAIPTVPPTTKPGKKEKTTPENNQVEDPVPAIDEGETIQDSTNVQPIEESTELNEEGTSSETNSLTEIGG